MATKTRISNQERYFFHNNLAILLKAVEGRRTTVDLRNEACITGVIEQVDGYMNIVMKDAVFVDPRGDSFNFEMFFVHSRNIRYVHIPAQIRIIPAIREQLHILRERPMLLKSTKRTWKTKRAQQKQMEDISAVHELLQDDKLALATRLPKV